MNPVLHLSKRARNNGTSIRIADNKIAVHIHTGTVIGANLESIIRFLINGKIRGHQNGEPVCIAKLEFI